MKFLYKLFPVAGLLCFSFCNQSTPGVLVDLDMGIADLSESQNSSDMPVPDPGVTIPVTDCAAASLIRALNAANDESAHPGPDVIALKSGCVYTLKGPDNWWYGPTGLPAITSDITIRPETGGTGVVIERNPSAPKFRLFYVNGAPTTNVLPGSGTLTLKNLTLRNGLARGGNGGPNIAGAGGGGGGGMGAGGAIFAQGSVHLSRVTMTSNVAQGGAGTPGNQLGPGGGMGCDGGMVISTTFGQSGGGGMKQDGGIGAAGLAGNGGAGPLSGSGGRGAQAAASGTGGTSPGAEHGGSATAMNGGQGGGGGEDLAVRGAAVWLIRGMGAGAGFCSWEEVAAQASAEMGAMAGQTEHPLEEAAGASEEEAAAASFR